MKVVIVAVLIIILAFLGFQFYTIVVGEVDQAQISQINTINDAQLKTITVDKPSDLTTYTHRVSTYEQPSDDLVKAASTHIENADSAYIHIFYFVDDMMVHEEFQSDVVELGQINKEILILSTNNEDIRTNLDPIEMVFYDMNDQYMIHVTPNQTGLYQIALDGYTIEFENIERK